MNNRILYYRFLFLLIAFLCLLTSTCQLEKRSNRTKLENQIIGKENQLSSVTHILNKFTNKFFLEKKMDYLAFSDNIFFKDSNKKDITWSLPLEDGPYLIFKYSFLNCSDCIEKQFEIISDFSHEIGIDKIKILGHFESLRDFVVFKKNKNLPVDIFMIESSDPHPILKDNNNPYFFILNGNKPEYTFIPLIEKPELTSSYLTFVKRYFDEEGNQS